MHQGGRWSEALKVWWSPTGTELSVPLSHPGMRTPDLGQGRPWETVPLTSSQHDSEGARESEKRVREGKWRGRREMEGEAGGKGLCVPVKWYIKREKEVKLSRRKLKDVTKLKRDGMGGMSLNNVLFSVLHKYFKLKHQHVYLFSRISSPLLPFLFSLFWSLILPLSSDWVIRFYQCQLVIITSMACQGTFTFSVNHV